MAVGETFITGRDDEGHSKKEINAGLRSAATWANNGVGPEKRTPPDMERYDATSVLAHAGALDYDALDPRQHHSIPVISGRAAAHVVLRHMPVPEVQVRADDMAAGQVGLGGLRQVFGYR